MKQSALAVAIAVASSFAVVGCGGSSSSSDPETDNVIDTGDGADTGNGNDNDAGNGGVEIDGPFIVDTGYVAGTSAYTGLTSMNGVVYASRIDATDEVIVGGSRNGEPVYNSVILRAAEGADEFTVVQEIPGEKVGGLGALMVTVSEDDAGNVLQDGLVVACLSGNRVTSGEPGPDEKYDDLASTEVALRFYVDQDLENTTAISGEEKEWVVGSAFVQQSKYYNVRLNTCSDIAVIQPMPDYEGDTALDLVLVGKGFSEGNLYPSRSLNWQLSGLAYDFSFDKVYPWLDPRDQNKTSNNYPDIDLYADASESSAMEAVEPYVVNDKIENVLISVRRNVSMPDDFGLTSIADRGQPFATQNDNVFNGAEPQAMALSALQQFPGANRFYAVHAMSEQSLNGLAVFDVSDFDYGTDGGPTRTRLESTGQVGFFCRGELTFVGQQGLCMDGTNPGTFRFFEVPLEESQDAGGEGVG